MVYQYPVIAVGIVVKTWNAVKSIYGKLGVDIDMDETELHEVDEFPAVKREVDVNGETVEITIEMMETIDKKECTGFPHMAREGYYMIGVDMDAKIDVLKEIHVDRLVKIANATTTILPGARVYLWSKSS